MRENYWVCLSEKRIYHSKPLFDSELQKNEMHALGITNQEKWVQIPRETATKYASGWKPHYVYSAYTTAEYEIIDCPELKQYQINQKLEGNYIPIMNLKSNILEVEEVMEDISIDSNFSLF